MVVGLVTGAGLDPDPFVRVVFPELLPVHPGCVPAPVASTPGGSREPAPAAPSWLEQVVCDRADLDASACSGLALAIHEEARAAQLDPLLVLAVIEVESSWNPEAVSARGARGLMQLRKLAFDSHRSADTAGDRFHPVANVRAGIRYLARLHRQFRRFRDPDLALVAYNAGPHRVAEHLREGGVPDRLRSYPKAVHRKERALRRELGDTRLASAPAQAPVRRQPVRR